LGTRVCIPPRRNWFSMLFLCVWLLGWAAGELGVLAVLLRFGPLAETVLPTPVKLFLGVWLSVWTLGGLTALWSLLNMLAANEEIRVQNGVLEHFWGLGRWGKTRVYPLHQITGLRADRQWPPVQGGFTRKKLSQAGLNFVFENRVVELGRGLSEDEGRQLLAELQRRHSSLKERD